MGKRGAFAAIGALTLGLLQAESLAIAQDNPELGIDPSVEEPAPGAPRTGTEAPAPNKTDAATGKPQGDHQLVIGSLGVGFFGLARLPVLLPGESPDLATCVDSMCQVLGEVEAPSIGVRTWLDPHVGVEMAMGFHLKTGEIDVADPGGSDATQDTLSIFGLALHAGVPLAVASTKHLTFQFVPFVNLGVTSGSITDPVSELDDWDLSGLLLELGANAGVELQFGFIGLPRLALQGTLGLAVQHRTASAEQESGTLRSLQTTAVQTSVDRAPWEILTGGLSAIYYF
ncbi:MAG: hypothetical protein OXU20_41340 [Myxococcales bacterium]|nr:hypothetical protein [Myxococcales bacterium]MDD9970761.1 hypothetical protein [Myxococcales bacterium]